MQFSLRTTGFGIVLAALLVAGCSTTSTHRAPVSDSGVVGSASAGQVNPATLPGAENAGKPGYYTVQPGDTLYRIASNNGQSWHNIVAWNNLSNPNVIEVGQVLRVVPPEGGAPTGTPVAVQTTPGVAAAAPASQPEPAPVAGAAASSIQLIWPAQGQVITKFDGATNKGIDIAGKAGEPVVAAAGGRVIYVGSGVRGYGNLVIIKHNDTFLTAYAHNQKLLVKEDQEVKKGQKIAEMGSSDADRVKLHFEVRRSGKPVDPLSYLPPR